MKNILFFLMMSIMFVGCLHIKRCSNCANKERQTRYITQYEILYPDSTVVYTDTIEETEQPRVLKWFNVRYLSVNNGFEVGHKVFSYNPIRIVYIKEVK